MQTKKFLHRVAIVLLIAVFSISGIVACGGGQDITGSRSTGTDTVVVDPTTPDQPTTTPDGTTTTPETPTTKPNVSSSYPNSPSRWDDSTYRSIYVPFAGVYSNDAQGNPVWNYATVSSMDRDTLTQLWKDLMDAKGRGNGKNRDFFLRNLNNNGNLKANNDYYFFDADYNIRHKKYPNVVIKEFMGGVMTMYYHDDPGSTSKGTIVVGGLYKTALANASRVGNDKGISYFLNGREVGDLEVLILNVGATTGNFTFFGLDITYFKGNDPYSYYRGLKTDVEEWYKGISPGELSQVLTYDVLRTKYECGFHKGVSYYFFSEGDAEIRR